MNNLMILIWYHKFYYINLVKLEMLLLSKKIGMTCNPGWRVVNYGINNIISTTTSIT